MSPTVSVIMGVYNCSATVDEAIISIINQTYQDWELIVCDDGSTDDTYTKLLFYLNSCPQKVCVLKNDVNLGLNKTLNRCLVHAKGKYIARQDGDDVSLPYRFEKQVSFLESNKEYAIVSSSMIYFDENGKVGCGTAIQYPGKNDFVKGTPFCHAPCMMRKDALLDVGGYSEDKWVMRVEDYNLWFKMYNKGYRGYNISEPLYRMRDDSNARRRRKYRYRINEFLVRLAGYRMLGIHPLLYIFAFRPLIIGLLPSSIYRGLREKRRFTRGTIL